LEVLGILILALREVKSYMRTRHPIHDFQRCNGTPQATILASKDLLIWNREKQEETTALMQRLAKQNELLHARVDHDRAEALKPGTSQHD
jgi:hypothetical protein